MAKEEAMRKGMPIGNYGQFIHRGNPMQDSNNVIFLIPQEKMASATIIDKDPSTKKNYTFPRLQTIH